MARIRPGTMPVRLPGVAQVIKQVGPKRWAPNQIEVMQEAERIRKRQEDGQPVDPRDIMAWAQLAQFVLKDETLVGGLVNMLSRGQRKDAIKGREERAIAERQALEDRQGAFMAEYPVGAVVPGEPLPGGAPPAPAVAAPETMGGISPAEEVERQLHIISQFETILTQEQARPGGSGEQTQITSPQHRANIQKSLENAKTSLKTLQERAAAAPLEGAAPSEPPPTPQAEAATRAQATPGGAPVTRASVYRDVVRADREREIAERQAEIEHYKSVARDRNLTVSDLYGLAATAKSPEAVRTLMAMVDTVVERDPAFAPRSLSELMFGGAKRGESIGKELIDIWGQSQKRRRGETSATRIDRQSRAEKRYVMLDPEVQAKRASATQRTAAAGLAEEKTKDISLTRGPRIAQMEARAARALAGAREANARAGKIERRFLGAIKSRRGSTVKDLPVDEQAVLAEYARWVDAKDKNALPGSNPFRGLGPSQAREKVNSLVLARHRGKKTHSNVRLEIESISKKEFQPPKIGDKEMSDERKLTYYSKTLRDVEKKITDHGKLRLSQKDAGVLKKLKKQAERYEHLIEVVEGRLGIGPLVPTIGPAAPKTPPAGDPVTPTEKKTLLQEEYGEGS